MTTVATARAAIVAKLNAIANIGKVHDYERYAKQEGDFRTLYLADIGGGKNIRGWHVRRLSTTESSPSMGRFDIEHRWQIRGYMALDDSVASEKTFDDLIEAIRDAFRADESLGGTVDSTISSKYECMTLNESTPVMFAGVLCHSARLTLATRHSL